MEKIILYIERLFLLFFIISFFIENKCYGVISVIGLSISNSIRVYLYFPKTTYNKIAIILGIIVSFVFLKGILQHCI